MGYDVISRWPAAPDSFHSPHASCTYTVSVDAISLFLQFFFICIVSKKSNAVKCCDITASCGIYLHVMRSSTSGNRHEGMMSSWNRTTCQFAVNFKHTHIVQIPDFFLWQTTKHMWPITLLYAVGAKIALELWQWRLWPYVHIIRARAMFDLHDLFMFTFSQWPHYQCWQSCATCGSNIDDIKTTKSSIPLSNV